MPRAGISFVPTRLEDLYGDVLITSVVVSQVLQWNGVNWVNATVSGMGTVTSVALAVPAELTVSGSPVTGAGTITLAKANQSANLIYAGPASGAAAAPSFRALTSSDLPAGTGTVTGVYLAAPPEFTVSGSPVISSGTITLAKANQSANLIYAGPATGSATVPSFRSLVTADLPAGTGTVTGVYLTAPAELTVAGSPITSGSGTINLTKANQGANLVYAGPTSGSATVPSFRSLVTADLPAGTGTITSLSLSAPAEFTVSGSPVTSSGTITLTKSNQGANLVYAGPASGSATVPSFRGLVTADLPAGAGTVTGVYLAAPPEFTVSGSPVTSSGTITLTKFPQPANTFYSGPTSGPPAVPLFRGIAVADLPASVGTVQSVSLAAPAEFTVSGSPVTTSGTITLTKASQGANTFYAGPASGSATVPSFRTLSASDLPAGTTSTIALAPPPEWSTSGLVAGIGTVTLYKAAAAANHVYAGPTLGAAPPSFRPLQPSDVPLALSINAPASVTASLNDYDPGPGMFQRWQCSGNVTVTGMAFAQNAETRFVWNVGGSTFTLTNQGAGSAASNRWTTSTGGSLVFGPNRCALMQYDVNTWRVTLLP